MKIRNYFKMNSLLFLSLLLFIFLVYFKGVKQEYFKEKSNSRNILSASMTLQNFKSKTNALKKEVNAIASKNKYEEYKSEADDENIKKVPLKQSRTIVYNRIDKAGSTTLIGE